MRNDKCKNGRQPGQPTLFFIYHFSFFICLVQQSRGRVAKAPPRHGGDRWFDSTRDYYWIGPIGAIPPIGPIANGRATRFGDGPRLESERAARPCGFDSHPLRWLTVSVV